MKSDIAKATENVTIFELIKAFLIQLISLFIVLLKSFVLLFLIQNVIPNS